MASIGLWRNPDGKRPNREALATPLKGRYALNYDLSSDDIEVSLDNGPRQKKRDGRLSIPIAPGQTRDLTFFLQKQG